MTATRVRPSPRRRTPSTRNSPQPPDARTFPQVAARHADQLGAAADLIAVDEGASPLLAAVGAWLRAEAATQAAMEPLTELLSLAIETSGGPKAYLRVGKQDDGEIAMQTSTNEQALAVAAEVRRYYGASR